MISQIEQAGTIVYYCTVVLGFVWTGGKPDVEAAAKPQGHKSTKSFLFCPFS